MSRSTISEWSIQAMWWVAGIFATGAVWYFLSQRNWPLSIVSGVAALLFAAIAIWFHKMRDVTAANNASAANALAEAQLKQLRRSAQPYFNWRDGETDWRSAKCNYQNLGGAVSSLAVRSTGPVKMSIFPAAFLAPSAMGQVQFAANAGKLACPIEFDIEYTTTLENRETQRFVLSAADRLPERI